MELRDLIIDVLRDAEFPMKQGEILASALKHPRYNDCLELQRVEVPLSAIARCLTKHSGGSNPIFGVQFEGKEKQSQKRFFLATPEIPIIQSVPESALHPHLVEFAYYRFQAYCKTINALKTIKKRDKIGKWTNPDIVGINPVLLNLNRLFQQEVEILGMLSSKVLQFYSFELKLKIDKSNITECYFQAVSNSSWANFAYLVVGDLDRDAAFLSNLNRLNNGYGVGIIKLNSEQPINSEIIISARERNAVDINFMNFLSDINQDFYEFISNARKVINDKRVEQDMFDHINHSK